MFPFYLITVFTMIFIIFLCNFKQLELYSWATSTSAIMLLQ